MNKSITQATQNDNQISKSIKRFFTRFHVSSALKASNAYKMFLSLMIPCLNATVPKRWNSLQKSMIKQSLHIVLGFGCLLLDGQMEVHFYR